MDKFWDGIIKAGLALLLISVPLFFIYHQANEDEGYFFSIYGEAKEALAQGLILVLFCAWILKMNGGGGFRLVKTPLNLPLTAFLLIILLSLLWAKNPYEGLRFSRRWASHILLYFIAANNIKTLKAIRGFMALMLLPAIAVAGYGIAQYYGWEFPGLYQVLTLNATMGNPNFAAAYLVIVIPLALAMLCSFNTNLVIASERHSAVIANPAKQGEAISNSKGIASSPSAPRNDEGKMAPRNDEGKMAPRNDVRFGLLYLITLGVFTHLIVTQNRASWVGLIAAVAVMFAFSVKRRFFLRPLVLNVVSVVVIANLSLIFITPALVGDIVQRLPKPRRYVLTTPGADGASTFGAGVSGGPEAFLSRPQARPLPGIEAPPPKPPIQFKPSDPWWFRRFASIFNLAYCTNRQRIEIWKGIAKMVKARPFLGVGIGNFSLIYPAYQTKGALATYGAEHFIRQAHNEYFQFATELGLIGLAGFIWFAVAAVRGLWRRINTVRVPSTNIIYLGLLGSILAALTAAAFSFNLQNEASSLYFWFVVGMAGAAIASDRSRSRERSEAGSNPFLRLLRRHRRKRRPSRNDVKIRYWLVWLAVIGMLVTLPKVIYLPLKAYWYQRRGLCLAISGGYYPGLYTERKAKLAIPELKKSLEFYFPSWETHFLLGLAYSQLEDFANAEKAYLLCLRFNSNYAKAYYNLGNAYYHTGRYNEAIECYLGCLKIDPTFADAQKNLAAAEEMRRRKRGLAP